MKGRSFTITSDPDPLLSILVKDHLEQRAILHLSEDQLATVVRASDYNCPSKLLHNTIGDGRRTASKAGMKGWRGRMDGSYPLDCYGIFCWMSQVHFFQTCKAWAYSSLGRLPRQVRLRPPECDLGLIKQYNLVFIKTFWEWSCFTIRSCFYQSLLSMILFYQTQVRP